MSYTHQPLWAQTLLALGVDPVPSLIMMPSSSLHTHNEAEEEEGQVI